MPGLVSLQARLLAVLVLVVGVALATVAIVARASTTNEFTRYVDDNRQDMQFVAQQIAASTGERLVVTSTGGRVILDSSGELLGETLTPDRATQLGLMVPPDVPAAKQVGVDVLFVRRSTSPAGMPADPVWTLPAPKLVAGGLIGDDREASFLNTVTRSLVVAVLVGGLAAVVTAVLFARGVLRPIGALTAAARTMEQGDLSQRVQVRSRDEIGQLAQAFNAMADGLARTEQLRRSMVADVAHELRTPLTNLRGYLEALRDGVIEVRRETIESLYDEAVLLSHLVDDMQDLSLSDAGRLSLHREALDTAALVSAAVQAAKPHAAQQGVSLVVDDVSALPPVYADPQRIGQVLRNLLGNGLAYTPAGGTVRVSASSSAHEVRIEVRDTGCGIAAEHLPNVFERFYRADPSRARATGGAGLGLALVKQFVTAHGGRVEVASTLGAGSCFSFTLPAAQATTVST
jgi:signal transduction histidine kinase